MVNAGFNGTPRPTAPAEAKLLPFGLSCDKLLLLVASLHQSPFRG
jgi:hypothetical protein